MTCKVENFAPVAFTGESEVAISIYPCTETQRHLGIICYSAAAGDAKLLELKGANVLGFDPPKDGTPFLRITALAPRAHLQLVQWCRKIFQRNYAAIPFGFSSPTGIFDPVTLTYIHRQGGGLTCSSFVLAIFDIYGTPLLDYETWPTREEDVDWQCDFVERIARWLGWPLAHEASGGVGNKRYRPEEVAAAAHLAPWPCDFDRVKPVADEIVSILNS